MTPTPMQADQLVTITVTAAELNMILAALNEAPYRVASPIIQKIMAQVADLQSEPEPPALRTNGSDTHAPN